jgi:DNA repair exonuclease SbcCD ATPase subunit
MKIERLIYSNTNSSKVFVYENDNPEPLADLVNSNKTNAYILSQLGMSKEDFLNYYVIGQGNSASFFAAGDAEQKKIISRISNFNEVDIAIKDITDKEKAVDELIIEEEKAFSSVVSLIEYIESDIAEARNNFEFKEKEEKDKQAANLAEEKQGLLSLDKDNEANLASKKEKELQLQAKNVRLSELGSEEQLTAKLTKLETDKRHINSSLLSCKEMISKFTVLSGSVVECPKCNTKFIPSNDMTPDEINEYLETLIEQESQFQDVLIQMELDKNDIIKARQQVRTLLEDKKNLERRIKTLSEDINSIDKKRAVINNEITRINGLIKTGKSISLTEVLKPLTSKLNKQKDEKIQVSERLKKLKSQKAEYAELSFHMGTKGFKTFLANKSIRTIQDICNYFLNKFETNIQTLINGYKVLKSGEVRDKIEIQILKNGVNKGTFKRYSGGEKSRVNVCGILSVNRLINNSVEHGKGLDLLCLDENISYLDSSGQTEIIKILASSGISTILVLHNMTDKPYKNKVFVQKKQEISTIL